MPFTNPSASIQAFMTDQGRAFTARATMGEVVFQAIGFSCGRGGYVDADPSQVVPITGAETSLIDPCYPDNSGGTEPFDLIEAPTLASRVYNCRLPATLSPTSADYGLGEVGVWAQVKVSNVPSEVGQVFLMALAHMPVRFKTNRDVFLFRVVINY